jgi:PAS domain S-box-containing protein
VLKDAPFTNLDLITCRNLLIYFQPNAQKKVLSVFHFGLRTGGVLFLGASESSGALADEFETIDQHCKLYRKRRNVRLPVHLRLPLAAAPLLRSDAAQLRLPQRYPDTGLLALYDRLLDRFMPPSFLVDERRELIDSFGGAEKYLRPRPRRPSNDLLDLLEPDLRTAVAGALQRAVQYGQSVSCSGVPLRAREGLLTCRLEVEPFDPQPGGAPHYLISLAPLDEDHPLKKAEQASHDLGDVSAERLRQLEDELRYTRENLQATVEELETSNEELQASNEELVASNEELQSTNEELHSVNEELYTVNAEHRRKIDELADLNRDTAHLLECSDVATVFLDRELRIRKFTPKVAEVFDLLPGDIGRSLVSFNHKLRHPSLEDELRHVLEQGERIEKDVAAHDGRIHFMRVLPYQKEGQVQGVVLTLTDITALQAARGNVSRLAAAVESSDDAILAKDLDGRIIAWNSGAKRLYGFSAAEAIGKHISLIVPEERHGELEETMRLIRAGRGMDHLETQRRHKDGRLLDVWVTLSPIRDGQNQVVGASAVARDVTQRKQSELALRDSEERYRRIVNAAMDAVVAMDEQGIVREWNASAANILGWPRDEALGRPLAFLIVPERFREQYAAGLRRYLATGESTVFNRRLELPALRRDGREFLAELTVSPVRTAGGHIFTAFLRDVTARKRAETLLRRKALEASLLHQATAVAAETDSFEQALQSCVTIVCELTGWPVGHAFIRPTPQSERLVPTNIWHLSHPQRFQKLVAVTEQSAFRRGEGIPGIIWHEGRAAWIPDVRKSDNFPRVRLEPELEITAAFGFPVFVQGELEAVLEFFHPDEMPLDEDLLLVAQAVGEQVGRVLERKRTRLELSRQADELLQINDELTRSNKELDDFAYVASHDLREPLRGIQNYASFLVEDYAAALDNEGRQKLLTMRRLTERLDELIESLLKFSRVGRLNLDIRPTDLNQVVADVLDMHRPLLEENRVEICIPSPLPIVACDRVHAGEVFANLISNAVKYNDKRQKRLDIGAIALASELAGAAPQDEKSVAVPILFVRDNGIGIRDKHIDSIFKIFKRLHGRDQFGGGSGAGLTIVKKIIERHGGRIWVESKFGEGTTFYFHLGEHAAVPEDQAWDPSASDSAIDQAESGVRRVRTTR